MSAQPQNGSRGGRPGGRARGRSQGGNRGRGGQQQRNVTTNGGSAPVEVDTVAPIKETKAVTDHRFADVPNISSTLKAAIPFEFMSEVQAATLETALNGTDILAQARTGTGKTLAFLIPAIERISRMNPPPQKGNISILVLSPTRELALQIETEAEMLIKTFQGRFGAAHAIGGTNMSAEATRFKRDRIDILVATPGRLVDHLENSGVADRLSKLQVFILDEADRMLDMGFRPELEKIVRQLPSRQVVPRQHLLFSATINDAVEKIARPNLSADYKFISTLKPDEVNTHERVPQHFIVAPFEDSLPLALAAVEAELARSPTGAKIMCFLPTARATALAADVFRSATKSIETFEIHSRKSQAVRTKAADQFRASKTGILFSSDVTARGVDFPNVSLVMQVGVPASAEQYIHRLGRTARAGQDGQGLLIVSQPESFFLRKREIAALPLQQLGTDSPLHAALPATRPRIAAAMRTIDDQTKAQAYAASLGFYNSSLRDMRWSQADLVSNMNDYAVRTLLHGGGDGSIPGVFAKTVGKMGLKGVPGLNIVREQPGEGGGRNGGGRGAPRGRGGASRGGDGAPSLESRFGEDRRGPPGGGGGRGRGGRGGAGRGGRGRGAPY